MFTYPFTRDLNLTTGFWSASYDWKTSTIPYAFYRAFQMTALLETATKQLKKESNVRCYFKGITLMYNLFL